MFLSADDYASEGAVWDAYPQAVAVAEVEHGWMVFLTMDDYHTWLLQV